MKKETFFCPICLQEAVLNKDTEGNYRISCVNPNCLNPSTGWWDNKEDAIEKWLTGSANSVQYGDDIDVRISWDLNKISLNDILELKKILRNKEVFFDTGSDGNVYNWEWDWSLSDHVKVKFIRKKEKKNVCDNGGN